MTIRSDKYPLDVSSRYPESVITGAATIRARDRISGLMVHPDTDDLTNEVLYKWIKLVWIGVHKTLAYCDVIDLAQEAAAQAAQNTDTRISALESEVGALKRTIETLVTFFGVIVPAWINKNEVENGDDMGIIRPSAAELGLVVTYDVVQREPGFGHEDVVAIDPPAGSLVARGGRVRVTVNLQG